VSLALSTLIYEWRRYLAAVVALAVAGLLVLAMTGMFMGMSKSFSANVDRSPAEIMVLPPESVSLFDTGGGQPRRIIPQVYEHPAVVDVKTVDIGFTSWSNFPKEGQTAKSDGVQLFIVDPVKGAITLPSDFSDEVIRALQEPYAVVVDRSSLGKLGVQPGDRAKMNGYTVWVRDTVSGYPSLFNAKVFVSTQTAKLLHQYNDGPQVGALVVKIKDPARVEQVVTELNAIAKGQFKAWSREALSSSSQRSMLKEGGIVVMIGFAVVVGTFIGIGSLRLIVMELSLWVGLAGLLLTAALTGFVGALAAAFGVPLDFPLFVDLPVAVTLLIIAILSGVLSLGVLKKSQPADLLR